MAFKTTLTVPTVTGSHDDFSAVIVCNGTRNDLPSGAYDGANEILNGGGNLRAYTDSSKTTQLSVEIVSFVTGASPQIEVWIKLPAGNPMVTAATIYIEADTVETAQPAVTNAYGRNAVWSDYEAVLHLSETPNTAAGGYVDSTGNGHDATANSLPSASTIHGLRATALSGSAGQYLSIPDSAGFDLTNQLILLFQARRDGDGDTSAGVIISKRSVWDGTGVPFEVVAIATGLYTRFVGNTSLSGSALPEVDFHYFGEASSSAAMGHDLDGVTMGWQFTPNGGVFVNNNAAVVIGAVSNSLNERFNGAVRGIKLAKINVSPDWRVVSSSNQSATTAWFTNDGWADSGGGGTSVEIPTLNNSATTYLPIISISDHQTIEIPTSTHSITTYAPTITIGSNTDIEIPTLDNSATTYAPVITVSDHQAVEIPTLDNSTTTYAPTITVSGNVSIEIPTSAHAITTYAPDISVTNHITIEIPVSLHQITTYAPQIQIGGTPEISVNLVSAITVTDNCSMSISAGFNLTTPIQDDETTVTCLIRQQKPLPTCISSAELTNYANIEPEINLVATMRG